MSLVWITLVVLAGCSSPTTAQSHQLACNATETVNADCHNGGTCFAVSMPGGGRQIQCKCTPDWMGDHCESRNLDPDRWTTQKTSPNGVSSTLLSKPTSLSGTSQTSTYRTTTLRGISLTSSSNTAATSQTTSFEGTSPGNMTSTAAAIPGFGAGTVLADVATVLVFVVFSRS